MSTDPKYWAFISYSHRDQAWAEWLHKALETYRVPRRLVGRETMAGPVPRRLFPVFRDLEELPSSPNLSGAIDEALLQSRYLIVIASPYAAVSKWVDQEVARFRALGRSDRILCLIVDGEPHADLQPGKGFLECFPPSLRTVDGIEPIAADVRLGKDGKPATKLKLIAGLLGVGLDELRRRERRRRILQNLGVVALSALSAVVLAGLWQMQQREKREALAQQALRTHIETVYEKGRQELIGHNQARAAVYLNEAYRLGIDTPSLRLMLARAMRIVESEKLAFQTGAPISAIRFSPDAKKLLTRGRDNVFRVWDTATGQKRFEFPRPGHAAVAGPRFSRSNRFIYMFVLPIDAAEGRLSVRDAESGKLLADVVNAPTNAHNYNPFDYSGSRLAHLAPDHTAEVDDLLTGRALMRVPGTFSLTGFSRDGRRLLTGGENGEVALWDADHGRKIRTLVGLHSPIVSLDDTEDGTLVAAAARDGSVRAWRVSDGALRLLAGHPSTDPNLIFNIDGARLLTWAADGARVWNTSTGALVYAMQFAGASGNNFDISSNGRWLMTSSSSRLTMQDIQSGAELFTLDGHRGLAGARDISDDDREIATGGPDGRAVLWEVPRLPDFEYRHNLDPLRWKKTWSPGVAAIYSHNGSLIATGAADGMLKIWNAATHELLQDLAADLQSVNVLDFSADDKQILSGGENGGVKIWNVGSGRLVRTFDCKGKEVQWAAFSPDGRTIAATILGGVTRIWSADTGELLASFGDEEAITGRYSPDSRYFVVGGSRGAVKLWDIEQRRFLWSASLQDVPGKAAADIASFDYSRDGQWLLAATGGQSVFVLQATDGHVRNSLLEPSASRFNSARFDHSGERAVMSDANGIALIWRIGDSHTWVLQGHAGSVRTADFSSDGLFVLTSSVDATARIWDAANGEMLDIIAEHGSPMPEPPFHAATFSPDGHAVLTGSVDGVIREWELREESRNSARIDAVLRCRVPWHLDGEILSPTTPDDAACSGG